MEKDLTVQETDKTMTMAQVFAESGMFPDIKTAAQAFVKIVAGRELGLSPMQSINSFYFVNGRLGIVAQAMSAMVKQSNKYDYAITTHTEQECAIDFFKTGETENIKLGTSKFDIKMAAKAGIVNKDNWKNYPMNMLFARALMNGIRWFCPDAVSATVYSAEELEDLVYERPQATITMTADNITSEVKNGKKTI